MSDKVSENNTTNDTSISVANQFGSSPQSATQGAPDFSISSDNAESKGKGIEMPFDFGTIRTAAEAIEILIKLRTNGVRVIEIAKKSEDIVGDISQLDLDIEDLISLQVFIKSNFADDEELSETDLAHVENSAKNFEESFTPAFGDLKDAAETPYSKMSDFKSLNPSTPEIKNALHQAYLNDDSGMLKNIEDLISGIESYNESGQSISKQSKRFVGWLNESKVMEHLDGFSAKIAEYAESSKALLEDVSHLNQIYENIGVTGGDISGPVQGLESTMYFVDKVINLVDLPGINFAQKLWNDCYKPMIDICITGMNKIANLKREGFENIGKVLISKWLRSDINEDKTAPTRVKDIINSYFEGGWDIFNFMWNVMVEETHRLPNDNVIKYFEDNYEKINTGTSTTLPYEGNIFSWKIKPGRLMSWAVEEKYKLWAMFYGNKVPLPTNRA